MSSPRQKTRRVAPHLLGDPFAQGFGDAQPLSWLVESARRSGRAQARTSVVRSSSVGSGCRPGLVDGRLEPRRDARPDLVEPGLRRPRPRSIRSRAEAVDRIAAEPRFALVLRLVVAGVAAGVAGPAVGEQFEQHRPLAAAAFGDGRALAAS